MLEFAKTLYDELLLELEIQDNKQDLKTFTPDQRLESIQTSIGRLKANLKSHQFGSEEEEIYFFKKLLPLFLSLHFYYKEKFELESIQLVGTPSARREYFDGLFRKIDDFFKENSEFFKYYRSGKTNLDNYYFLRKSLLNQNNTDPLSSMEDPSYFTVYSLKIARILAYTHIEQDIRHIFLDGSQVETASLPGEIKLEWTDSKAGLIELIYSLKEQGAFNNGKVNLKTITRYFENIFSVRLGNSSSTFQEILSRKSGHTNYIDKLKDKLLNKIDEIEEGNMH